jgi:hypothetical protein
MKAQIVGTHKKTPPLRWWWYNPILFLNKNIVQKKLCYADCMTTIVARGGGVEFPNDLIHFPDRFMLVCGTQPFLVRILMLQCTSIVSTFFLLIPKKANKRDNRSISLLLLILLGRGG